MSLVTPYSRPDQFARRSIKCRSFTSRRASSSGGRFARPPHEHNTDGYERHPDDLMAVNSVSSRKVEQDPVPAIWTECHDGGAEEDRDSSGDTGHDWRTLDARPSTPLVPRLQGHRRPERAARLESRRIGQANHGRQSWWPIRRLPALPPTEIDARRRRNLRELEHSRADASS